MAASRSLLVVMLLLLGGMIYWLHLDIGKVAEGVANMADRIERIKLDTAQRATGFIGKPRVPPIRHVYKKTPTVVDQICRP